MIVGVNDLASVHPELLKEWDYVENDKLNIKPDKVTCGSHMRVWWKCPNGHKYQSLIKSRSNGYGCRKCASINKGLIRSSPMDGESLQDKFPELVEEWDYEKNGDLLPTQVKHGSNKTVYWVCKVCGNKWRTKICNRTISHRGCSKCASVYSTSFSEQAIYYYLYSYFGKKEDVLNRYKFTDNQGSFEIDIFIPSISLAVEYDGVYWHQKKKDKDDLKNERLAKLGVRLIRIKESKINEVIDDNIFYDFYKNYNLNLSWAIKSLFDLLGYNLTNFDIDVENHRINILELFHKTEIKNSLAVVKPEIAQEWNYEKNGDLLPSHFRPYSDVKVWWKCKYGHSFYDSISNRSKGVGCPVCSNREIVVGFNDLATTNPKLAEEWDYENNYELNPTQVACNSSQRVSWKCKNCGYIWTAIIYRRNNGSGCPACAGNKVHIGFNDLLTVNPKLAEEWDYEENNNLLPTMFVANSTKIVGWKCKICGNKWKASIVNRNKGRGCPVCGRIKSDKSRSMPKKDNSFQDKHPELVSEWDYEKNGDLLPSQVNYGSKRKVWWKCKTCGKEWQTAVSNRSYGYGCPKCAKKIKREK